MHVSDSFPLGAFGAGPAGRKRKSPEGVVSKRDGVAYDCPARVQRKHKLHPAHTRNGAPPLLCRHYQLEPGKWSCEACLRTRPPEDSSHTLGEGCRFADGGLEKTRRAKKQQGERARAGPVRDPAIPAGGVADISPVTDDDLGLDLDVPTEYDEALREDETLGILCLLYTSPSPRD